MQELGRGPGAVVVGEDRGGEAAPRSAARTSATLFPVQQVLGLANRWIAQAIFFLCALLLIFLSVTLFLQVVFRYVLQQPLPWSEEAARFALVWYSMLAAAVGAWTGQHFIFRWATLILSERYRLILRLVVTGITLALLGVMIWLSWAYVAIFSGQTASATHLDMRIAFGGIPAGLSCFFMIYLLDLLDGVLSLWTGITLSPREAREREIYARLLRREAPVLPIVNREPAP
jgi:TRAP-type C4-dicarboxylate transport system permease small subunit